MITPNSLTCASLYISCPSIMIDKFVFSLFRSKCDLSGFALKALFASHPNNICASCSNCFITDGVSLHSAYGVLSSA